MAYLTAAWRQLAFINYEVDPALLEKYVPLGTELDLYKGTCYVSVIAFYFMDTKVLGVKFPYAINFEGMYGAKYAQLQKQQPTSYFFNRWF